jgi:EmrB/QacA subfamily drug resistance transporter
MPSPPDPRRWKALALLCTAFFMVILDASITIVGLPSIQADLGFSDGNLQWVVSAYALTFGGLLLLGGRCADLLGRRRVFMAGTLLFVIASLGCGLAWSDGALIAARAIQGVAAAVMTPTALSILMTTFEEGAERNKALGIWGSLGGVGGTAGWLIGGPITDGPGWEWLFFINIPVGLAVLALSRPLLAESRATIARRRFDLPGAATVTAALVCLVYAVVEAPDAGWASGQTLGLVAVFATLLAVFAWIEARSPAPLVPLSILRSRVLLGGNAVMLLLGMLAFGMPFILTLYAQQVLGMSAVEFGLSSAVMPVMAAGGSIGGQALVTKAGFRPVAAVGMVLAGIACLLLTAVSVGGSYLSDIFLGLLVFGPGLGAAFVASSIASLSGVAEHDAGLASGLNNTAFQVGAALGTAVLSTVAVSRTEDVLAAGEGDQLLALTEGFQSAFAAAIAFAALGLLVAVLTLGRRKSTEVVTGEAEPAMATAGR